MRIVEPGAFDLMVGASSGDIPLQGVFDVTGATRLLAKNWRMESRMEREAL